MKLDFKSDWIEFVENTLGISNKDIQAISLDFFNHCRRTIETRPRKVFISKEFIRYPEKEVVLQQLIQDINNGNDINPYLSRKIQNPEELDELLNSWKIHHFHFYKLKRSKELIFARVTNEAIFFIQVLDHDSWHEQELLEIISNNWPFLMESLNNIEGNYFDQAQIKTLRSKNVASLIKLRDGKNFLSEGGQHPLQDIIKFDILISKLNQLEDIISRNETNISNALGYNPETLKLILTHTNGEIRYLLCEPDKKIGIEVENLSNLLLCVGHL